MKGTGGPPWTNSKLGRVLLTALGAFSLALGMERAVDHEGWGFAWIPTSGVLMGFGLVMIVMVWTSRLYVRDGDLIAHHFWGDRAVPLASVVDADDGWLWNIVIRTESGASLRSWVSGGTGDELWTTRSQRIARAVVGLARQARSGHSDGMRPDLGPRHRASGGT